MKSAGDAHDDEAFPRLAWMDFRSGCCQRLLHAEWPLRPYPSSAIAASRPRPPMFDAELSRLIALTAAALSGVSSSMAFPILAIEEAFMDCCRRFETSLIKRGNYATARPAKTRTGDLTNFAATRLPYLLDLQQVQIVDDRADAFLHRLLGAAGKIEK